MTTAVPSKPATNMKVDPSSDVYRSESHPLDPLFLPKSVAVIGASERTGSVGRSVLWNLLSSPFGGTVFPVNSKRSNVLGIKAYPSVADLPDKVDLVVVTTPADTVPALIARVRGHRHSRPRSSFRPVSRNSESTAKNSNAKSRQIIAGQDAHDRPQLPGRDEPGDGA